MSCPYYWWNNHYACRKSGRDVNEDTYYKYCRNYDYDDCPIYKGNDTSGCFLTSACVDAQGLPDDCHELTVLRAFRDGYMKTTATGHADVCRYYHIAPMIVEKIKGQENSIDILNAIYHELILPCVRLIEEGQNEQAYKMYRDHVLMLEKIYIPA